MQSAEPPKSRLAIRTCRVVLAVVFGLLTMPVYVRGSGDWEAVYVAAAKNLRTGQDVLTGGTSYVYPPFGALFAVPFSYLPRPGMLFAWAAMNVLATAVLLAGCWRLAGGRGLPGRAGTTGADYAAFWLGGLLAFGFMLDSAGNWQTDLLIGAVMVGGGLLLAGGRSAWAGVAFGVAAAFKCTPLLFAPYLLWKRRFVAAAAVPVVAVGLNLLPDLAYPPPDGTPRLLTWKERFLTPMAGRDYDPGIWASGIAYNHSLAGVTLRLLTFRPGEGTRFADGIPRAERPSATELKRLNLAIAALLGFVALVSLWRRPAEIQPGPILAAELGMVFAMMLVLSPMSSKPHFVTLLLPQMALARIAWDRRDRVLKVLVAFGAVAGLCTGKDIIGKDAYEFLVWYGLILAMTVGLFLGCCHARFWYGPGGE